MIRGLRLRGDRGTLLWGHHPAATLRAWSIKKTQDKRGTSWQLRATIVRLDAFQVHQQPLLFTAARVGGYWAWPVEKDSLQLGTATLLARLGPPEQ